MSSAVVYDKAKYHYETVENWGLDCRRAGVHTAFFLGWLMDHDLVSDDFKEECSEPISQYKSREIDAVKVYEWCDEALIDDMLNDVGNAFAQAYFDFDRGQYLADYQELLVRDLPSEFHALYSWENYEIIRKRIDERFQQWQRGELVVKSNPPGRPSPRRRSPATRPLSTDNWTPVARIAVVLCAVCLMAAVLILMYAAYLK